MERMHWCRHLLGCLVCSALVMVTLGGSATMAAVTTSISPVGGAAY